MGRTRYVIIGITQAGIAAAETIRSLDRNAAITLLSGDPFPVTMRRLVAAPLCPRQWHADEKPVFRGNDFFSRFDITTRSGVGVSSIDPARRLVHLAGGADLPWDRLLLACGNVSVLPEIAGLEKCSFVRYASRPSDFTDLVPESGRDRGAVIFGSGYLAVKAAEAIAGASGGVSLVHPEGDVFSFIPDAEVRRLAVGALAAGGVELVPGERIAEVSDISDTSCGAVTLSGGRNIPCGLLVIIPDVRPEVRLAQAAGLTLNRGVVVNGRMETSAEGIYAAGECAVVSYANRGSSPERISMPCPDAVRQGRAAAMQMVASAAKKEIQVSVQPHTSGTVLVALDFFRLQINSCGIVNPPADSSWEIRTDTGGSTARKPIYRKFVMKGGRLAGFILVNAPERCGYLKNLIDRRVLLSEVPGALSAGAPYSLVTSHGRA